MKENIEQEQTVYTGKNSIYQLTGNAYKGKRYSVVESNSLNSYQNLLYNRALFGLSVYSDEELKRMRWDKRIRIINVHKRAQRILNIWKQEVIITCTNLLLQNLFPKSDVITLFIEKYSKTDFRYISKMSFRTLKISRDQIINKLIIEGILPKNFYELKSQTDAS